MPDKWCAACGIWLAPYAEDKVSLGEETYHEECLRKKLQELTPYQVRPEMNDNQLTLYLS
jgi:hypothetical protein